MFLKETGRKNRICVQYFQLALFFCKFAVIGRGTTKRWNVFQLNVWAYSQLHSFCVCACQLNMWNIRHRGVWKTRTFHIVEYSNHQIGATKIQKRKEKKWTNETTDRPIKQQANQLTHTNKVEKKDQRAQAAENFYMCYTYSRYFTRCMAGMVNFLLRKTYKLRFFITSLFVHVSEFVNAST